MVHIDAKKWSVKSTVVLGLVGAQRRMAESRPSKVNPRSA